MTAVPHFDDVAGKAQEVGGDALEWMDPALGALLGDVYANRDFFRAYLVLVLRPDVDAEDVGTSCQETMSVSQSLGGIGFTSWARCHSCASSRIGTSTAAVTPNCHAEC